jgi:transposase
MTHQTTTEAITTIGIDLGKNTFHLIGMDARGRIVLRRKVSRGQLLQCVANLPVCLIGLEACAGARHCCSNWDRAQRTVSNRSLRQQDRRAD